MVSAMSTVERLKLKNELSRALKKRLSSSTQSTILQKFGIYYSCYGIGSVGLDFDECEDSVLLQLKKELQNLVASNGDATDSVGKYDDDETEKKALRAAMLEARFSETIKKANGGKSDEGWEKLKKQKRAKEEEEILKKRKREEYDELRKRKREEQINKERRASRLALELVEKNVDLEDDFKVMKELEMLIF